MAHLEGKAPARALVVDSSLAGWKNRPRPGKQQVRSSARMICVCLERWEERLANRHVRLAGPARRRSASARSGGGAGRLDGRDAVLTPKEKGTAELVEGKVGKAVRFPFEPGRPEHVLHQQHPRHARSGTGPPASRSGSRATARRLRRACSSSTTTTTPSATTSASPSRATEWTKVTVAWRDLVPVLPGPRSKPLGTPGGNPPSKLSAPSGSASGGTGATTRRSLRHRRDPPGAEDRARRRSTTAPTVPPLARVLAKLKAGRAGHRRDDGRLADRQAALGQPRGLLGRPAPGRS